MVKRLLYIEDLYNFYSTKYKRSTHFSSEKSGEPIVVQVHGKINFEESDKNKDGLMPVHLQACHTNLNVNNSNIEETVMTSALPSFSNRPILGYIHKVVTDENPEGQWEFYGHNMHEDENGELVYDEVPIGIIPESCNAQLVYDEKKGKTYCEVDGYIFEEYSRAAEILQREGECAVSVELSIRELSYDGKLKCLNIEDFWFSGVTILGKNECGNTIKPGMAGSNIKLSDFNADNNSLFAKYENKMIEFQERLEKLESTCSNKNNISRKEEEIEVENKENFEEVTDTEEVTETEETTEEEVTVTENESEETVDETSEDETVDTENSEETTDKSDDEETEDDEVTVKEDNACGGGGSGSKKKKKNSVENEPMTRTYEISHDDIRYALYNLLASYEESDNDWYYITGVYDSYFVYENWNGGKIYGQKYTKDNDNVAFDGERYTLHKEYLTDSEYTELQSMRSNYSSIIAELETYKEKELDEKKEELFNSKDYNGIRDTKEFSELKKNSKDYSIDDLTDKLDKIISNSVKNGTFSFSANVHEKKTPVHVNFAQKLADEKPKKNSFLDGLLNC